MARPVILDTDIGTDIDDTWALAMLLASPELDLKLITCVSGDVAYRGGLTAALLAAAGRSDVPIGLGIGGDLNRAPAAMSGAPQSGYAGREALAGHPKVLDDGVQALVDAVLGSDEPVTVISIGPLSNVAEALRRSPQIAGRAQLVGMQGSVRVGYRGGEPAVEYNVLADIPAAQVALAAPWEKTITPLDSCGSVVLRGESYRRFFAYAQSHPASMAQAVLTNYRVWLEASGGDPARAEARSTTLYDVVAVYLAFADEALATETLPITVTDDGFTRIDPAGAPMRVATGWRDATAFDALLLERLCW